MSYLFCIRRNNIDYLLSNLFEFPNLIKLGSNRGLLIGFKGTGWCNYIDVSKYFKKVYVASFTAGNQDIYYSNFAMKRVTSDMKVVFGYIKYHPNGTVISNNDSSEPSDGSYIGCNYFILGELK